MNRRAVFLGRDGVVNPYHYNAEFGTVDLPVTPEHFRLLPGVAEAVVELNRRNLSVIIVSNQPGMAKGRLSPRILQAITVKMVKELADAGARLDDVLYCPHHPQAVIPEYRVECECHKPKPGLLLRAAQERNLDLAASFMVGDGVDDILAGRAAGVTTILLGARRCSLCEEFTLRGAQPDRMVADLKQAVQIIGRLTVGREQFSPRLQNIDPCVLARGESTHTLRYLSEAAEIAARLDVGQIERVVALVRAVRERVGRIFFLGVGGGAAYASHAACDFRKFVHVEAYCISDNFSELTARGNDAGWDNFYLNWLRVSRLQSRDMVFVFSGGGDLENIRANLVNALQYARKVGCAIAGVLGRTDGYTAQIADACVTIPIVNPESVMPHTESFQALVWHLMVSHPALNIAQMKCEPIREPDAMPSEMANREEHVPAAMR